MALRASGSRPMVDPLDGAVVFKMSGSGNDFVLVDGRGLPVTELNAERIRAVCRRRTGMGADGLVVLESGTAPGAVRFHFFNADGGRAEMCGNAALCATRMAAWLELAPRTGMVLETDVGPVRSRCLDDAEERAEIELPAPAEPADVREAIPLSPGERSVYLTSVGVPHLVVPVEELSVSGLMERGRELRSHRAVGAAGANVNFVSSGGNGWAMRTYERGVEAETLACGTGAVATAAVLNLMEEPLPVSLQTASGATLTVSADSAKGGRLEHPTLVGEARFVFRAILGGAHDCTLGGSGQL